MTKEEIHAKAVDYATERIKEVDKNSLSAIADYDRGLVEGYENGYQRAVDDILRTLVSGYIYARKELLKDKICAIDTSVFEDSHQIIKVELNKDIINII